MAVKILQLGQRGKRSKRRRVLCLLAALVIALSGCETAGSSSQAASVGQSGLAEGQTELYGKVKKVAGNEVLLVLGSYGRGGMGGELSPPGGQGADSTDPAGAVPDPSGGSTTRERPTQGEGTLSGSTAEGSQSDGSVTRQGGSVPTGEFATGGGSAPPGEARQRPAGGTGGTGDTGGGQFFISGDIPEGAELPEGFTGMPGTVVISGAFTLTGEERTILIPITATVTSGQGEGASSISFTQIAEKNILRVVMDKEGAIIRVEILA